MKTKRYAVLTGDVVNSSKLTSEQSAKAMQWLRDAANKFTYLYPESIIGELDTFRHDSWQMLMAEPSLSLRAAVYLRVSLMRHSGKSVLYDSRVSIGVGDVETIDESRISNSRGPAFTISGKNLDAMERTRLTYEVQKEVPVAFALLGRAAVPLLDCLITDWTPTVARAVHGSLERLTQEKIAELLPPNPRTGRPVTRQAVADSLERGHWGTVEEGLTLTETDNNLWNSLY